MLSGIFQEGYSRLRQQLTQLSDSIEAGSIDSKELTGKVSGLQQWFAQNILPLPFADLDAADFALARSYNTELHKQLRLLATDAMFFGSARQAATVKKRTQQLRDRLETLVRYCDVLLDNPPK
ncbi:MAG: heterocyst frequency control protein PatD [Cyanobacteriota bacterium]|nr:heterocyst frequency control protein PatD [Cyanobacteriota bacterium]